MWINWQESNRGSCLFFVLQLSQQLDGLLGMLCADVAPADGASIQQNLKLLEEKLQAVGPCSPPIAKLAPLSR